MFFHIFERYVDLYNSDIPFIYLSGDENIRFVKKLLIYHNENNNNNIYSYLMLFLY